MNNHDILRAWRDGEFLDRLTEEQRAALPTNPADLPQIDDDVLRSVTGSCGCPTFCPTSMVCTPCPPMECSA